MIVEGVVCSFIEAHDLQSPELIARQKVLRSDFIKRSIHKFIVLVTQNRIPYRITSKQLSGLMLLTTLFMLFPEPSGAIAAKSTFSIITITERIIKLQAEEVRQKHRQKFSAQKRERKLPFY